MPPKSKAVSHEQTVAIAKCKVILERARKTSVQDLAAVVEGIIPRPDGIVFFRGTDNSLGLQCVVYSPLSLPARAYSDLVSELVQFVDHSVSESYRSSGWGWDPAKKRAELMHQDCRHILIRDNGAAGRRLAAFVSVRITREEDESGRAVVPSLYVWEIHVHTDYQRRGIGSWLMTAVIEIARVLHLDQVILTVFTSNVQAQDFYKRKMGFEEHFTSPQLDEDAAQEYHYSILSLPLGAQKGSSSK
jgi:ribosomal protein S18 acetylase RimI-like enzyme